jgi:hypothetical protein
VSTTCDGRVHAQELRFNDSLAALLVMVHWRKRAACVVAGSARAGEQAEEENQTPTYESLSIKLLTTLHRRRI